MTAMEHLKAAVEAHRAERGGGTNLEVLADLFMRLIAATHPEEQVTNELIFQRVPAMISSCWRDFPDTSVADLIIASMSFSTAILEPPRSRETLQ